MQESEQSQEVVNPIQAPDAKAKTLLKIGVWVSIAYLLPMLIYSFVEWSHMKEMKPDGFATFLSGAFAPLAFLWLVLGFRQQGDELQNSARALWLQGEELRNSVEQQRQLVEVSREQLADERADRIKAEAESIASAQPQLTFVARGGIFNSEQAQMNYVLTASGRTCSNVLVKQRNRPWVEAPILQSGNELRAPIVCLNSEIEPILVEVDYDDALGIRRRQRFMIPVEENGGHNGGPSLGSPKKMGNFETVG